MEKRKTEEKDVIICRCEEVYLSEIKKAIATGASLEEVKRLTRTGMGLCQGRTCGRLLRNIYANETATPLDQVVPLRTRPPVRPVTIEAVGRGTELPEFQSKDNPEGIEASKFIAQILETVYMGEGPLKKG
jgi:bacterioferritin-associated ferredoxin